MIKLVEKYSDPSEQEWISLFYRILKSRIGDWHPRNTIRNRHRSWLRRMIDEKVVTNEGMDKLEIALEGLPARNMQDQQLIHDVDSPKSQRNNNQTQQVHSQTAQPPNATRPSPPAPSKRFSLKSQAEIIHQ